MGTTLLIVLAISVAVISIWAINPKPEPPKKYSKSVSLKDLGFDVYETFSLSKVNNSDQLKYIVQFCKELDSVEIQPSSRPFNSLKVIHNGHYIGHIADGGLEEAKRYIANQHMAGIGKITSLGDRLEVEIIIAYKSKNHPSENISAPTSPLHEKTIFVEESEPALVKNSKEIPKNNPANDFNLDLGTEGESGKEYLVSCFELTGVHIGQRKNYLLNYCEEYDPVVLKKEKNNPASKLAIAVKHENKLIGYIAERDLDEVHGFYENISQSFIASIEYDGDCLNVEIDVEHEIVKRKKKGRRKAPATTPDDSAENDLHPEDFMRFAQNKISPEFLKPQTGLADTGSYFFGKKVCISGTLDHFPYREELAHHLWKLGADIDTSVGKACNILICGAGAGPSKCKQAQKQGVEVMEESELLEKLNGFKSKYL